MKAITEFDVEQLWDICGALKAVETKGLQREKNRLLVFAQRLEAKYWDFEKYQKRRAAELSAEARLLRRQLIQHQYFVRERDKEIMRLRRQLDA